MHDMDRLTHRWHSFNGGTGDPMAPQCLWCQIPDKGKDVLSN